MIDYGPLLLRNRKLDKDRRLKIGLVAGRSSPSWIRDLIEYLAGIPQFDLNILLVAEPARNKPAPDWLADRLYTVSKRKYSSLAEVDLSAIPEARVLEAPVYSGRPLPERVTQAIEATRMDLLIWLADSGPEADCASLARLGVFTVQLGDGTTEPPYWREVIEHNPVSSTIIYWNAGSFERGRAVYTSETSTQQDWAFTKNAEEPLAALRRMFATLALELLSDAPAWAEGAQRLPEVERSIGVVRTYPSTGDSLRFIASQTRRSARIRVRGIEKLCRWFLAVRRRPELFYRSLGHFSPADFEEIPLRGTHMADPFVTTHKNRTWLFFENVPVGGRGRLSCMELGPTGSPGTPAVILQKPYHLSYPCVFSHRGDFFLIPESSANRTIQLYRATRFPFEFQHEANLMEDFSAVDTTPFFHDGRWYFFTTTTEPFLETFLFWSNSLDGKWELHPLSPVSSSVRNTRAAGHLFHQNGRLLRPTQNCSVRYGYGMTMNQIKWLTSTEFKEERIDMIGPNWRPGLLGTHTLNSTSDFEVIDGIRYEQ